VRYPARFIADNLVWTHLGTVWATWRVPPVTYPYLSDRAKLGLHARTRAALMGLRGESMLLSLCEPIQPAEVVEAMIEGVDLNRQAAWREVAAASLDALSELNLYRRVHFLAVQLPTPTTGASVRSVLGAAGGQVGSRFGLPAPPVSRREYDQRAAQAAQVGDRLRQTLQARPATSAELWWIYARAARRGIDELPLDDTWQPRVRPVETRSGQILRGPNLRALGEAVFKEGGEAGDVERPAHRRYLRVETEAGTGYQAFLAMSDMPHLFTFPDGAEWFARPDAMGFPIDWAARIKAVPNADAQVKAKRQARQLVGQVGEWEGDASGAPQTLAEAIEGIDDERAQLAANPSDPELETTVVFSVWAEDLAELERRADQLRAGFETNEYSLPRPTGGQLSLYGAMLPGSAAPREVRDYVQFLLPRDLAAGMPFAGTDLGDPAGMLLGVSLDAGTVRPVLFDPARGPTINRSGSLGLFGELGSGKSYLAKCLMWATLARGGQVVTLDRTQAGEYAELGAVMPGRTQVVRLSSDADVCLDPLRVFHGDARERYTLGFLTLLCRVDPTGVEGVVLAEAVEEVANNPRGRLDDVVAVLSAKAEADPGADLVARKLRAFARAPLARLAFGDGAELNLDADLIVFHTPGLSLPDKEVLERAHLARQMLPDQLFSQALLFLVAAVARTVTFADKARFAAALFDEAWAITASMEGRQLLIETTRDGRKHNAALWLASQHPSDIGDDRLSALLRNRFVFRQSRASARLALEFMEMEVSDASVALLDSSLQPGQCLFRDLEGRVGLVQVLEAPLPELHEAFDTNPDTAAGGRRRGSRSAERMALAVPPGPRR
jgi:hypothetical protein